MCRMHANVVSFRLCARRPAACTQCEGPRRQHRAAPCTGRCWCRQGRGAGVRVAAAAQGIAGTYRPPLRPVVVEAGLQLSAGWMLVCALEGALPPFDPVLRTTPTADVFVTGVFPLPHSPPPLPSPTPLLSPLPFPFHVPPSPFPTHPGQIHAKNRAGDTALHLAAAAGRMECLEALLEFGADPGATSANGDTPLARAKAACVLVRACVLRADVAYSLVCVAYAFCCQGFTGVGVGHVCVWCVRYLLCARAP